jgi:replicative DNA helicase
MLEKIPSKGGLEMPKDIGGKNGPLLKPDNIPRIESGLLGAAIINPEYIADLTDLPKDFFTKAAHRDLALTLKELWLADQPVDIACVHAAIQAAARTKTSLVDLADMTGDAVSLNFSGHLQLLQDYYKRRKLKHFLATANQKTFNLSCEPDAMIGDAIQGLTRLLESEGTEVQTAWEVVNPMLIRGESGKPREPGIPSGLGPVDKAQGGGFRRGNLIILAARPGVGKSAMALQIANNAGKAGYKVLLISLEMSAKALMMRLIGSEAGIEPAILRQVTGEPWAKARPHVSYLANTHLWICDNSAITSAKAIALAKELKSKHGLDLVILDYIQRFSDTLHERHISRNHLIGGISKAFANLARQTDTAALVLSQLNRRSESSADRKPTLADLRDSGELEQDADVVMLLHRPGYHDEEANQNEAWLYLEKNREGPTGPVRLFWDEKKVRFFSTDTRRGDV